MGEQGGGPQRPIGEVFETLDCSTDPNGEVCASACMSFDRDLGSSAPVRFRELIPREPASLPSNLCLEHEYTIERVYAWRAPADGEWVIDSSGAESTYVKGVVDASCSEGGSCKRLGTRIEGSHTVRLNKGQPVAIVAAFTIGDSDLGGGVRQINISRLRTMETECLDWADNDGDGLADCADSDCAATEFCTTTKCADEILPSEVPLATSGDLTLEEHVNRYGECTGSCSRERVFAWRAPATKRYVFDASGSDIMEIIYVRRGGCVGPRVSACAGQDPYDSQYSPSSVGVDAVAGEWLYIVIDASSDNFAFGKEGDVTKYVLRIREAVDEVGPLCDDGIDNDGNGARDSYDRSCGYGEW